MNATLKRATVVLSILVLMGTSLLVSLVTGHYSAAASDDSTPRLAVRDIAYVPVTKVGVVTKEDAAKNVARLEAEKAEAEKTAEVEEVIGSESVGGLEVVEVGSDWQSEEAAYTYDGDDFYGEVAAAYGLVPYDGSGYYDANMNGVWHEGTEFAYTGGYLYKDSSGMEFTWYPESVLPGGGLDIPGRHVGDEGYICDQDGNVCLASDYLPEGTVVNIPFGGGTGVVYDSGCGYNDLDVYVSWQS